MINGNHLYTRVGKLIIEDIGLGTLCGFDVCQQVEGLDLVWIQAQCFNNLSGLLLPFTLFCFCKQF